MKIMKLHNGRWLCLLSYRGMVGRAHVEASSRQEAIRMAMRRAKEDLWQMGVM